MSRYEMWEIEIEKKVTKRIATEGEMKKYRKVFKLLFGGKPRMVCSPFYKDMIYV